MPMDDDHPMLPPHPSSNQQAPYRGRRPAHRNDEDALSDFSDEASQSAAHASSSPSEAIFDRISTRHSSPRTSEDDISELPTDSDDGSAWRTTRTSSHIPSKHHHRSPFRNPSSVRAIQLSTTPPPHLTSTRRYRLSAPSRHSSSSSSSTPRSVRSYQSASARSSGPEARTEFPLVLLHVTVLPLASPYPQRMLEAVLPPPVLEDHRLLRESISPTVLDRGILLAHPSDDYDLIEERLLESLELAPSRILGCGSVSGHDDDDDDDDACADCGRRVRRGSAAGCRRRWDIRIYAANGLMRAGAWAAAWREMERVDVEIGAWIGEPFRRELETRREEEEEKEEEKAKEAAMAAARETAAAVAAAAIAAIVAAAPPPPPPPPRIMDPERSREIHGDDRETFDPPKTAKPTAAATAAPPPRRRHRPPQSPEIPLPRLMRNYVRVLLRDRKNLAILLLGALVLFLALAPRTTAAPRLRSGDSGLAASGTGVAAAAGAAAAPSVVVVVPAASVSIDDDDGGSGGGGASAMKMPVAEGSGAVAVAVAATAATAATATGLDGLGDVPVRDGSGDEGGEEKEDDKGEEEEEEEEEEVDKVEYV